jgi:hypothetical protein
VKGVLKVKLVKQE